MSVVFKVVSSCDVDSCSGGEKSEGDIKTNMSAPRDTDTDMRQALLCSGQDKSRLINLLAFRCPGQLDKILGAEDMNDGRCKYL